MLRFLLPSIVLLVSLTLTAAAERVALVIGNNAYTHGTPLQNCVNDARAVADGLREVGFKVTLVENASLQVLETKVREFRKAAEGAKAAWFYYAGHGAEVQGANYLIPVDVKVEAEYEVKHKTLALGQVLGAMEEAATPLKVVVLDCCRDNPFGRGWSRSGNSGLAVVGDTPTGTIIVYATAPGKVAADGSGKNSPFTEGLLSAMKTPGLDVRDVFHETGKSVLKATERRQQPWINSSYFDAFVLKAKAAGSETASLPLVPMPPPLTPASPERAPSTDPVRSAREKAALQAAVLSNPPRGALMKIARQDESEKMRLMACDHLLQIKDPGAGTATLAIHRSSKEPDIRWTSARLVWEHLRDRSVGDFLLSDFRSRGRKGPVVNWSSWTIPLAEMNHGEGMREMKKIWTADYDANNPDFVKQQIVLRVGLELASQDKSQIQVIKNRMKRLPASSIDDPIYFCLAVLGDESSQERIRSRLSGESPGLYAASVPFTRQSRVTWGTSLWEMERMIVEAAEKSPAPENLVKNLSVIADARKMWGESGSALKTLDVPFPAAVFAEASKHDLRIPRVDDDGQLVFNFETSEERFVEYYAPTLAAAGNRKVVERAAPWADAPDPSLRFRVAKLAALYLKTQPASAREEMDEALARQMSGVVEALWFTAPLKGETGAFGDEPGKLDLVEVMAVFDKKTASDWSRELMRVYEGLPEMVTDQEWFYDEAKKQVSLRPVPPSGEDWEKNHRWYREKLLFGLLAIYPNVWEAPDYGFIDKVSSFEFAQGMAKQGNLVNKGLASYESRQIDSVQQVTARVRLRLAQGGYYEVYPQVIQSIDFNEEDAKYDVIQTLREFTSDF